MCWAIWELFTEWRRSDLIARSSARSTPELPKPQPNRTSAGLGWGISPASGGSSFTLVTE
jgi:hypothetical protein